MRESHIRFFIAPKTAQKMSNIRSEIQGKEEFMKEVYKTVSDGKKTIGQLLLEAASVTHKTAIDMIRSGPRSGNLYGRWGNKKIHQSSAPGEPPKSDTGVLVQNITMEKEGSGYTVGSRKGAPHGFWLEFGTSKMLARPWLKPSFDSMVKKFLEKYRG